MALCVDAGAPPALQHLAALYESGAHSDVVVHLGGRSRRLHRAVLSASGALAACVATATGDCISLEPSPSDAVHVAAVEQALRFLYGLPLALDDATAPALFAAAAELALPRLVALAADFLVARTSARTAVGNLLLMLGRSSGSGDDHGDGSVGSDANNRVCRAAELYLLCNAVDMDPRHVARLPLRVLRRLLASPELYAASEFQRYRFVCAVLAAVRSDVPAADLAPTAAAVFAAIAWVHMSPLERVEVARDRVVPAALLATVASHSAAFSARVAAAIPTDAPHLFAGNEEPAPHERLPACRWGVEVRGMCSTPATPAVAVHTTRHAGSEWQLSVTRQGGALGVVLERRRAAGEEDARSRVAANLHVRLCGAPGSPVPTPATGWSSKPKVFEQDDKGWGWQEFVPLSTLAPQPWADGDVLRFLVTLQLA